MRPVMIIMVGEKQVEVHLTLVQCYIMACLYNWKPVGS